MSVSRSRYQSQVPTTPQLQLGDLSQKKHENPALANRVFQAIQLAKNSRPIIIKSPKPYNNPLDFFMQQRQSEDISEFVEYCVQLNISVKEQLFYLNYFHNDNERFQKFLDRLNILIQFLQNLNQQIEELHSIGYEFAELLDQQSPPAMILKYFLVIYEK